MEAAGFPAGHKLFIHQPVAAGESSSLYAVTWYKQTRGTYTLRETPSSRKRHTCLERHKH